MRKATDLADQVKLGGQQRLVDVSPALDKVLEVVPVVMQARSRRLKCQVDEQSCRVGLQVPGWMGARAGPQLALEAAEHPAGNGNAGSPQYTKRFVAGHQ